MRTSTSKTSGDADIWLLDTGPLVAVLSKTDVAHERCVAALESFRGHLVTSEAVLTEALHLVRRVPAGQGTCLELFLRGGALLVAMDAARLARCRDLMARYRDTPMDFADATLVALAEELGVGHVFTLDHRGFATYRWRRTRRFTIVP